VVFIYIMRRPEGNKNWEGSNSWTATLASVHLGVVRPLVMLEPSWFLYGVRGMRGKVRQLYLGEPY